MPIILVSKQYTDAWGNNTSFYRCNAGDRITAKFTFRSKISLSSSVNPIIFDPLTYTVTSAGTSWETEGMRVGDIISIQITDINGTTINSWGTGITWVNGNQMGIGSMLYIPDPAQQQLVKITVTSRNREGLECRLNHIENGLPGNDASLIDGELTRFMFNNISSLAVNATQNATIVGNQSGQYLESAQIKRISDYEPNDYMYEITVVFVNSGIYDQSWFELGGCLKLVLHTLWTSVQGESFAPTSNISADDANTGWFNEAHNTSPTNAVLVDGVDEIDYANPTSFTISVDGLTAQLGIGASYVPLTDGYYKNKQDQQGEYGMIIPTTNLTATTYSSLLNPDTGAGYTIQVTSINTVGTVTTITGIFTPNAAFKTMMENAEEGDRLFYLWIKCGNLNLLAFNNQLNTTPPQGGTLTMIDRKEFYDHSENVQDDSGSETWVRFDTEDDLAFWGNFLMEKGGNYESFKVRMEAFNFLTNSDFTLKETVFSLSGVQIDGNGVYLIDEDVTVEPQLPNTSAKRNAIFKRDATIDTVNEFGVSIYYPVVLDWKYWLPLLTASSDFYPNQNRDWQHYDVFPWVIRMELELIKDGLAWTYERALNIHPYNNNTLILSSIEYIRESDGSVVNGLLQNEVIRIKATHKNVIGSWSNSTWGMITIEPKEGSPRWISSTVIDYDGNQSNPLIPLVGETKAKRTITGDIVTVECLCDTTGLSSLEFSIGAKIKDLETPDPPYSKTTAPDDTQKTTSDDNIDKTVAP